jgi:DNA polymerase-3 subunit chi
VRPHSGSGSSTVSSPTTTRSEALADLRFYHLTRTPLERALPKLLERALAQSWRAVVIAGSRERVEALDAALWTYEDASFLPHGAARDGNPARQPVWLTVADENPNGARLLVLVDGVASQRLEEFERVLDVFDGSEESVAAARERWRLAKSAGHTLTYWQQTDKGWEQKA